MQISLAISSAALAAGDLPGIAAEARAAGFTAVDIRGAQHGSAFGQSLLLADPGRTRRTLADAGIAVACLTSAAPLCGRGDSRQLREVLHSHLITAADLGAPVLAVACGCVARADAAIETAARCIAAAVARAAEPGVAIALENGGPLRCSSHLWHVGQAAGGGSWGYCWNATTAEPPSHALPLLAGRLLHARLHLPAPPGVARAMAHWLGRIGYKGRLAVAPARAGAGAAAEARGWLAGL